MASIKVKYRPSSSEEDEGSIYYQVIHDRKPRQLSTQYRVRQTDWNARRDSVMRSDSKSCSEYIIQVRQLINSDLERFGRVIRGLERKGIDFSSDDIVDEYLRLRERNSLFNFMEALIAKLKADGRIRTAETYRATLNSFRKFRNEKDLLIDGLNRDIMESYEAWLRGRGLSRNTISFYFRILRAVYNRALTDEIAEDRHPFRNVYTGIEKTVKRALPIQTIRKIRNLNLSEHPALDFARDMFILSFMLRGMSLIDMAFLRKVDLQNGYISYKRRKTNQLLCVEWTSEMQDIVDKYPENPTEFLLPIIKNSNVIPLYSYRYVGHRINKHLGEIGARLHLTIPLTMYVARHSWASAAKTKGVPIGIISAGMGHESELTTRIYLASLETSNVDRVNSMLIKELKR